MTAETKFTAAYWQQRAKEIRTTADGTKDESVKQTLLRRAETYDKLAKLAHANMRRNREHE